MEYNSIKKSTARIAEVLAVLFVFSIVISTAAANILLALTVFFWLSSANFSQKFQTIKQNPVVWLALLFFAIYALGLTYGVVSKSAISDVWRVLLIPIFASLFHGKKWQFYPLYSFLLSLVLILFLSYLLWFDLLPVWGIWKGTINDPTIFSNHITHNIVMSFGAFAFAALALSTNTKKPLRLVFSLIALLMLFNVLFMVKGRTGHIVIGVLALLFFWYFLKEKTISLWLRRGIIFLVLSIFVGAIITPSSAVNERFTQASEQWKEVEKNLPLNEGSVAQRKAFIENSIEIIKKNPIIGVGTGGFAAAYSKQIEGSTLRPSKNPHNEYLMILVQLGIVGLVVFLAFLLIQWQIASFIAEPTMGLIARALALTFIVASMITSTLSDFSEGLLFYSISGTLFASLTVKWRFEKPLSLRFWQG